MNIKKLLLFSFLIILIPFIIVSLFISNDNIKFNYTSNNIVRVYKEKENVIESVPLEEYVYRVVSSEMPATFNKEALKAQLAQFKHNLRMTRIEEKLIESNK